MKKFEIPQFYRSPVISIIKQARKDSDPKKRDYTPTLLNLGAVEFLIPRHFGFCYGVENAIEIAYKTIEENVGKRIFLLSEMIHNPEVNDDLLSRGVRFLMDTSGNEIIDWKSLTGEDVVIIPAFGTTLEIEQRLNQIGINPYKYNTTCPFVEKVWNRSNQLGEADYTIVIHGKHYHEETKATFSHTVRKGKAVIVRDLEEARILAEVISGERDVDQFYSFFQGKFSEGFDVEKDLLKIGVVNQTTMLASETEAISQLLKEAIVNRYGVRELNKHFADTRDTLCYATNDNQQATYGVLKEGADLAVVVGGYNSSNTSHIAELCEEKLTTYFISSSEKVISDKLIRHFLIDQKEERVTENWLPEKERVRIIITSGASCPDSVVDDVIRKIASYFPNTIPLEIAVSQLTDNG
jgi:4-hydroxy-3-methylbut-2-en-1-yl diphosphate reductase